MGYALEHPHGGRCYHMSFIPGHPFDLGAGWDRALAGHSADESSLHIARKATAADWNEGRGLVGLFGPINREQSNGDDQATLMAAYERHTAELRETVPKLQLLEWRASGGRRFVVRSPCPCPVYLL